eukprot:CAMPEP_0198290664 /NCGR_PEP_ID=MMETSP1449-20131203/8442_1 /TAXON_ID=420275 /ORGANISM="Attheya septentrionalis, Strain CCMP2084" /LENGTH=746 /DNA_ID=CAMNT_0043989191 /DNA_START=128 /DNA_END=2368 /DNA_ORIENTATION=+
MPRLRVHAILLVGLLGGSLIEAFAAFSRIGPNYSPSRGRELYQSSVSSTAASNSGSSPPSLLPPVISAEGLSCSHDGGSKWQLKDVSYVLPRGARVGLVGPNGCGKSTFLKILAQATSSYVDDDSGVVYTGTIDSARNLRVAFVEQEPPTPSDVCVSDALLGITSSDAGVPSSGTSTVFDVVRNYRIVSERAQEDVEGFAKAAADMDKLNGWAVLTKADEVATRLRVDHLKDTPLANLSGGERKRVALAAALIQEPDVLLLDEPTNHLDLSAIQWLSDLIVNPYSQNTLSGGKLTILTVTHDRAFLEEVCDSILELENGNLYGYSDVSYMGYLEKKEERWANEDAAQQARKTKYKKELDWMRRQPQARETKQKARQDAFYKLEQAVKPTRPNTSAINLDNAAGASRRIGGNVLKLKNVSLKFGDRKMLDSFTYDFNRGDKIGIVGANGVGKSTFVKALTGEQPLDSGEMETGETVVFGIYDQKGIVITQPDQTVLDFVKQRVESRDGSSMAEAPAEAMQMLKQFQFPATRWNERVSVLSGGERRRLQMLSVLTKRPNFLLLDEPTNDIDLDTLTALEEYLAEYKGVLVVVSHDRYFTDKVTDHLFVFEGDGVIKDYLGSLTDYADCLIEQEKRSGGGGTSDTTLSLGSATAQKEDKAKRMERQNSIKKMKREISNKLEPNMEKIKEKMAKLQKKIDSTPSDAGWTVLAELTEKLNGLQDELDEKEMRWLEVSELLEAAEAEASEFS